MVHHCEEMAGSLWALFSLWVCVFFCCIGILIHAHGWLTYRHEFDQVFIHLDSGPTCLRANMRILVKVFTNRVLDGCAARYQLPWALWLDNFIDSSRCLAPIAKFKSLLWRRISQVKQRWNWSRRLNRFVQAMWIIDHPISWSLCAFRVDNISIHWSEHVSSITWSNSMALFQSPLARITCRTRSHQRWRRAHIINPSRRYRHLLLRHLSNSSLRSSWIRLNSIPLQIQRLILLFLIINHSFLINVSKCQSSSMPALPILQTIFHIWNIWFKVSCSVLG